MKEAAEPAQPLDCAAITAYVKQLTNDTADLNHRLSNVEALSVLVDELIEDVGRRADVRPPIAPGESVAETYIRDAQEAAPCWSITPSTREQITQLSRRVHVLTAVARKLDEDRARGSEEQGQ
jgi:hypothetical protein